MLASFFVGNAVTGYTLLCVICVVIVVGFVQEYKAEQAVQALRSMLMPVSLVLRDKIEAEIPSRELVPGDIVILRSGERVPADCVLLEEHELRVDESILTGESKDVPKTAIRDLTRQDPEHLVFMGTFILHGRCVCQVIGTGMRTEFGKISGMISAAEKELPLQRKINRIAEYMVTLAFVVSALTAFLLLSRNLPLTPAVLVETLIVVIALSVAAFPEGLPVVLISTLAAGAHRMAHKNAIVNRMSAIEALGETTVICSDKTGTITKGEMTVRKIAVDDIVIDVGGAGYEAEGDLTHKDRAFPVAENASLRLLLQAAVLCNDASIRRDGRDFRISGSSTEAALLVMAAKAGVRRDSGRGERVDEIPFTSHRKMMSVLVRHGESYAVYAKGAPELLLKRCTAVHRHGAVGKLTEPQQAEILAINRSLTRRGYRTLALATKRTSNMLRDSFEEGLIFLGIVAIEDPPRDEVREAVATCSEAGIRVKMLTGDSKETAMTIASEIGLVGDTLEGEAIDRLTDEELERALPHTAVFARVRPEHKLRIVQLLKRQGEVVTMTGDGVNDAPALKEAHVGVAMGMRGTDVARDVADLTLKDDHFSTIVAAVAEGRTVFSNIQKFTTYQISINLAQVSLIFLALLLGMPLPLLPIQILFMNLLSDEVTALTLGFAPASLDVMKRPPRRNAQIISRDAATMLFIAGTIITAGSLSLFAFALYVLHQPLEVARTTALVTMVLFGIVSAFNFRSLRSTLYELPILANRHLTYAAAAAFAMTLVVIYTPASAIFETAPIAIESWLLAIGVASTLAFAFDLIKAKRLLDWTRVAEAKADSQ
jgi:Ca2+-transporting ATPase